MYGSSMGVLQTSFLFLTPKAYTCYLPRQSPQMWAHQFTRGTRTRRPGIYHSPTACFLTKQKAALIATHGHSHRKKKLIMVTGWIYTTVKIGHPTEHMSTKWCRELTPQIAGSHSIIQHPSKSQIPKGIHLPPGVSSFLFTWVVNLRLLFLLTRGWHWIQDRFTASRAERWFFFYILLLSTVM